MISSTTKMSVWVQTRFAALHQFPDAPDEVAFLRRLHRHEFHVRLGISVDHPSRAIEFLMLKQWLGRVLITCYHKSPMGSILNPSDMSCEQLALRVTDAVLSDKLIDAGIISVTVSEDGENGATVTTNVEDKE